MEATQEVRVICPKCGHRFEQEVTVDVEPVEPEPEISQEDRDDR